MLTGRADNFCPIERKEADEDLSLDIFLDIIFCGFYWYWCRISKEKNNWVKKNRKADLWNRAWPSRLRFKKNARWSCSWKNAFHFLHFENTKWNFLVDAINVYRFCFQASSSFYQWLLILFKSFLTVARSYLFHIFLLFLYSLLFLHVQNITFLYRYI